MLLRHGNAFGILYATHIPSEGFQRFSVGHELGHYFLEGHIDHVLPKDGVHTSHAGFVSADPYELEADQFAAGLLMPSSRSSARSVGRMPGLAVVESLAGLCKTSLTATAIRYAELTDAAVAIVISTGPPSIFALCPTPSSRCRSSHGCARERLFLKAPPQRNSTPIRDRVADGEREEADIDIMDWLGGSSLSSRH